MPRELWLQNTAKSPSRMASNPGLNPPKNQAPSAPKLLTNSKELNRKIHLIVQKDKKTTNYQTLKLFLNYCTPAAHNTKLKF